MLRCFVEPKNFFFIKHWDKENAKLAAKITSNVIARYSSLPCDEKVSLALEATFECYLKFRSALLPEKINFYIRSKILNYIKNEIEFEQKHTAFAQNNGWYNKEFEEEKKEIIYELVDLARDTFNKHDYAIFYRYWIEGENLSNSDRVKACRLVQKLKERYETLDISRMRTSIIKIYQASSFPLAKTKKTKSRQMYWDF